jgi:hypothetical protein
MWSATAAAFVGVALLATPAAAQECAQAKACVDRALHTCSLELCPTAKDMYVPVGCWLL